MWDGGGGGGETDNTHVEVTRRDEDGEAEQMNSLEFYSVGFLFHSPRKT